MLQALKRKLRCAILALAIFGIAGSVTPAKAQIPVTDIADIVQSIVNTSQELYQWYNQIEGMREQYALAYAAYSGLKDWRNFGWCDALNAFELPWFDGVPGIDDIRNLASATGMSVQQLQNIFAELESIKRMQDDPLYRQNVAYQARVKLWATTYTRAVQRRITLVKMAQQHDKDIQAEQAQLKALQGELQALSSQNPPPSAAIQALNAKIGILQAKMQSDTAYLTSQKDILKQQEDQELQQTASQQQASQWDTTALREAQSKFWDKFSSSHPGQ